MDGRTMIDATWKLMMRRMIRMAMGEWAWRVENRTRTEIITAQMMSAWFWFMGKKTLSTKNMLAWKTKQTYTQHQALNELSVNKYKVK